MYEHPWVLHMSEQLRDCLQANVDWFAIRQPTADGEPPAKLLDYACGFGMVSRTLFDHAGVIRGIDISETMVDAYNDASRKAGIPPERMLAVRGNLLDDEDGGEGGGSAAIAGPEFRDVDAVFVSMALHHVSDPQALITKLVQRLAPGGVLVIMDWLVTDSDAGPMVHGHHHHEHHDHHKHDGDAATEAVHTVSRSGFSVDEMRGFFSAAGCSASTFDLHPHAERIHIPEEISKVKGGSHGTFFIAKARKS